ncbi:Ribonuclease BN, tRNA processing enzyme [Halogranum amylolyticum]|uniref:Ribonuclease BN, tRNA processing enzyme n=2 Tax=Halogranum amylolyticum TaxID=660520 RepID=A0A1H8VEP5_9EURY|nr:Ribonuclease BN, tRNA processing enzyme [Halogranum amylolyticum]
MSDSGDGFKLGTQRRTFLKIAGASGLTTVGVSGTGAAQSGDTTPSICEKADSDADIYVTVLGSGASALKNGRSQVGYIVHLDGEPRILVDTGGGTAAAVSEAGIDITALDIVLFTHLHVDHTSDFPAMLKASYQQGRDGRQWQILGPTGEGSRPGTKAWVSKLFDKTDGAYSYIHEFVHDYLGTDVRLETTDISAPVDSSGEIQTVYERDGLSIQAAPTKHGAMPSLAYRITYGGSTFTFTGDYSSKLGNVPTLAEGSDVLVQNRLLKPQSELKGSYGPKRTLHSTPEEVGTNAQTAGANMLVLSHVSRDEVTDLERELGVIAQRYAGPIVVAKDLLDIYPDGEVVSSTANPETGVGTHGNDADMLFRPNLGSSNDEQ